MNQKNNNTEQIPMPEEPKIKLCLSGSIKKVLTNSSTKEVIEFKFDGLLCGRVNEYEIKPVYLTTVLTLELRSNNFFTLEIHHEDFIKQIGFDPSAIAADRR